MSREKVDFAMRKIAAENKKKLESQLANILKRAEREEGTIVSGYAKMLDGVFLGKKRVIGSILDEEIQSYHESMKYWEMAGAVVGAIGTTWAASTQTWLTTLSHGASLGVAAIAGGVAGAYVGKMLHAHLVKKNMYNGSYQEFAADLAAMGIDKEMEELSKELVQLFYFRDSLVTGKDVRVDTIDENFRQNFIDRITDERLAELKTRSDYSKLLAELREDAIEDLTTTGLLGSYRPTEEQIEEKINEELRDLCKPNDSDIDAAIEAQFVHGLNGIFSRAYQKIYQIKQEKIDNAQDDSYLGSILLRDLKNRFTKFWNPRDWQQSSVDLQLAFMDSTIKYLRDQSAEESSVVQNSTAIASTMGLAAGGALTCIAGGVLAPVALGVTAGVVVKKVLTWESLPDVVKYKRDIDNRESIKKIIGLIEQEHSRLNEIIQEIEKTKTKDFELLDELKNASGEISKFRDLLNFVLGKENHVLSGSASGWLLDYAARYAHSQQIEVDLADVIKEIADAESEQSKVLVKELSIPAESSIQLMEIQPLKTEQQLKIIKPEGPTIVKAGDEYYFFSKNLLDGRFRTITKLDKIAVAHLDFSNPTPITYAQQSKLFHELVAKVENFPHHPNLTKYIEESKVWLEEPKNAEFVKNFNLKEKMKQQVLEIAANLEVLPKELVNFYTTSLGGAREDLSLAQELKTGKKQAASIVEIPIAEIPILGQAKKFDDKLIEARKAQPFILAGSTSDRAMIALDSDIPFKAPASGVLQQEKILDSSLRLCLQQSFDFLNSLNQQATGDMDSLVQNSQEFIIYKSLLLQQLADLYDIDNKVPKLEPNQRDMIKDFVENKLSVNLTMFRQMSFQKLFRPASAEISLGREYDTFNGRSVDRNQLTHMDELLRATLADTKPKKVSELLALAKEDFQSEKNVVVSDLFNPKEHLIQGSIEESAAYLQRINTAIKTNRDFVSSIKDKKSPIADSYIEAVCANIDRLIGDINRSGKVNAEAISLLENYKKEYAMVIEKRHEAVIAPVLHDVQPDVRPRPVVALVDTSSLSRTLKVQFQQDKHEAIQISPDRRKLMDDIVRKLEEYSLKAEEKHIHKSNVLRAALKVLKGDKTLDLAEVIKENPHYKDGFFQSETEKLVERTMVELATTKRVEKDEEATVEFAFS